MHRARMGQYTTITLLTQKGLILKAVESPPPSERWMSSLNWKAECLAAGAKKLLFAYSKTTQQHNPPA